ncbi:MAG: sigma 54-interacting transcriptional regulator [Deltaproteobacteria bacterium]|nr:sigma 54-interacting transcriptional regulator [Deltaproteobacteria bacterium]
MSPEGEAQRRALVVDPSPSLRHSVGLALHGDYILLATDDPQEALEMARREEVEVALIGIDQPLSLYRPFLQALRAIRPGLPFLLLLGGSGEGAATDDLRWPESEALSKSQGLPLLREKMERLVGRRLWAERRLGPAAPHPAEGRVRIWLSSSRLPHEVREKVIRACASPLPVLIRGEEGTGRSGAAGSLHLLGPWRDEPYIRLFCPELTAEGFARRLLQRLPGLSAGEVKPLTLFLESVDGLDFDLQGMLLNLLDEQWIGWPGLEKARLRPRVISSATWPLSRAVSAGRFRQDLGRILETLVIALPPLRERSAEIPRLAEEILKEQGPPLAEKKFSPEALQVLQRHYWPGNVRELESLVRRTAAWKEGDLLDPPDLVFDFPSATFGRPAPLPALEPENWLDATLSTLAHEIKNPLVAISTFAHLLPDKYEDREFREQFHLLVNQDVKRVNDLLENLLEYAQFTKPRPVRNDLNGVLVEVLQPRESILVRKEVQLTVRLKEDLPAVFFDEDHLEFVLRNILENVLAQIGNRRALRLCTRISPESGGEGAVELALWYDGQDGILRAMDRVVGPQGRENLSLALILARKVARRNGAELRVNPEEGGGTTIGLHFLVSS